MARVIIVGGVAGGASTAARLRRLSESAAITMFEKGGYVSFANCGMPYYIGGEIKEWDKLQVTTPAALLRRFNINVQVQSEVVSIDREVRQVTVRHTVSGTETLHDYDELVLAVGCEALVPRAIPGIGREGHFVLRSLEDTAAIEQHMAEKQPKTACICGGGFIGLELAEQLALRGLQVRVVEAMDQVMAPLDRDLAEYIHDELRANGVGLSLSDGVAAFEEPSSGALVSDVVLKSSERVPADLVILAMGVRPCTRLAAEAGLELTERGHIKVHDTMRTVTDPHVWAVGDAIEVHNAALGGEARWAVPLAGPANRQGRIAADNISGKEPASLYKGTLGASVLKVFGLTAASVGMNERSVRGAGVAYKAIYLHPNQHAGYYPGAVPVHLKLVFEPSSGKIYGAQAVGKDGVEKRIDVISTAMHAGLKACDLADLELCYAPPYGSARDPVNMAGMIAGNIMQGLLDTITPRELVELAQAGALEAQGVTVLDLRGPGEVEKAGHLDVVPAGHLLEIPLDELRATLPELKERLRDPDGELILSCASGQRAHYGARMLLQAGYLRCRVVTGSYQSYAMLKLPA